MYIKGRNGLGMLLLTILLLTFVACGTGDAKDSQKETEQGSEISSQTEIPQKVEITDATDILTKVWEKYEVVDTDGNPYNDRFDLMGGHFETAVMNMPAKYDLTKTSDLELMYCVPSAVIPMIDDAATMVHLMRASTFTAGAYHVAETTDVQTVVDGVKQQILENYWLDGRPDKYLVLVVDDQYIISAIGDAEVVDNFESFLTEIYGSQVVVQIKENFK